MIEILESDVLRYLGYRQNPADERVLAHIKQMSDEIGIIVTPKSIYRVWGCQIESQTVTFGGVTIHSKHLSRHLKDCSKVAVFAATLGARVDTIIRRYSVSEMDKAVVADAVCSAMTEALCNNVVWEIKGESEVLKLHPTTRFSPGFGDFDIVHQRDILALLDCQKRIGLTLTDSNMLCPTKSVTAVVGFRG